jgi:hypothetical protein
MGRDKNNFFKNSGPYRGNLTFTDAFDDDNATVHIPAIKPFPRPVPHRGVAAGPPDLKVSLRHETAFLLLGILIIGAMIILSSGLWILLFMALRGL